MGDCGPWGGAGEELLRAMLYGTAGRRPNRGCGPRAVVEATLHNVTKPHRPLTYLDAGREWASEAVCLISEWVNGQSGDHQSRPMAMD